MRRPRTLCFPLAAVVLALAPASSVASTVTATVASKAAGFQSLGSSQDGVKLYSADYRTAIRIAGVVLDDNGAAVPAGTIVHLTTVSADGDRERALVDLRTGSGGRYAFTFAPSRSFLYFLHVGAAGPVSAADGPVLRVTVVANVQWTTPLVGQRGQPYRFDGMIDLPEPARAGKVTLYRTSSSGRVLKRIASRTPSDAGAFHFAVRHTRSGLYFYQLTFKPADRDRWGPLSITIAVSFRRTG